MFAACWVLPPAVIVSDARDYWAQGGKQGLEVNRTELETVLSGGLVLAAGGRWERWGDPQRPCPPHLLRTAMLVMFHALPYQRMKAELISLFKVSADITGD